MLDLFQNPIISGLLGVLIGTLLGHRFSLGRDKRKEFNVATEKIRIVANNQLECMKGEVLGIPVKIKNILDLRAAIGKKRSKKIISAFDAYELAYRSVYIEVRATADQPFSTHKINLEKVPEYKCKLQKLISVLEPK